MSDDHKAALSQGRSESRAVREYLEALDQHRPRRGRRRTRESIEKRLATVEGELASAPPLQRLQLVQERIDLTRELDEGDSTVDLAALEDEFVKSARSYGDRKRISYAAWRELGVPAEVLARAGITRAG
jgi:hypothetical protein